MDLTLVDSCYSDLSGYLSMAQNHHHLQHLFDESNRFVLKLKAGNTKRLALQIALQSATSP